MCVRQQRLSDPMRPRATWTGAVSRMPAPPPSRAPTPNLESRRAIRTRQRASAVHCVRKSGARSEHIKPKPSSKARDKSQHPCHLEERAPPPSYSNAPNGVEFLGHHQVEAFFSRVHTQARWRAERIVLANPNATRHLLRQSNHKPHAPSLAPRITNALHNHSLQ